MRQYTTPVVQLRIDGHDLSGADVYVTFANRERNALLTITDPGITADEDGTTVEVHLTQEQTGRFAYGSYISVQVNWMELGERYATQIASVAWDENLIKEVL